MLFSTVLVWLLVALAFVIALPALWMFSLGFWPERVARLRGVASLGLLKSFLAGLVPLAGGVVLVAVLSKIPQMGALSVLAGGLLLAWGFLGSAGIAAVVGQRLWPQAEPWRQMKHGGLTLVTCALLPVVGWVVLLPLIAVVGWGIQVRAWFVKKPADAATPPPLPESP